MIKSEAKHERKHTYYMFVNLFIQNIQLAILTELNVLLTLKVILSVRTGTEKPPIIGPDLPTGPPDTGKILRFDIHFFLDIV